MRYHGRHKGLKRTALRRDVRREGKREGGREGGRVGAKASPRRREKETESDRGEVPPIYPASTSGSSALGELPEIDSDSESEVKLFVKLKEGYSRSCEYDQAYFLPWPHADS